jgi:hypothetical protein
MMIRIVDIAMKPHRDTTWQTQIAWKLFRFLIAPGLEQQVRHIFPYGGLRAANGPSLQGATGSIPSSCQGGFGPPAGKRPML